MKVLIFSQYFWPENFRINEIARALVEKGVDVEVITGKPNYPSGEVLGGYKAMGYQEESYFGIKIHRIPLIPRGSGGVRLAINYISFVTSGFLVAPFVLRGKSFDAIFVYAPSPILQAIPAIFLGRLKRCPVLLWVQDLWPESLSATGHVSSPWIIKGVERLVRWIYRKVDLLLVQSRAFIPRVQSLAGATRVIYYPNSFLEKSRSLATDLVECQGFDCSFPILFAGNIGSAQAVEVILEAATLLRSVEGIRFVMIGDGSRRAKMMEESKERGLANLIFPGTFPVEAMPALMEKASALLVTLADTQIFRLTVPSKVQAYLAAGRPIIGCLNGAGAEIIREAGAGVTVTAEDALALANAVKTLFEMPSHERTAMGMRGRAYYEKHFSHDKLVNELIEHIDMAVRYHREHKGGTI